MSNLLESYRVLGVKVGAVMADITTSYRQLCRTYHPDLTDDPNAEEQMKQINIAYTVLREKYKRESAFRDRQTYTRPIRRYPSAEPRGHSRGQTKDTWQQAKQAHQQNAAERAAASADAEKEAYSVLHKYFTALNAFDYVKAYSCLSDHDKKSITQESFTLWRESVARLYPMREFKIASGSSVAVVTWDENKTLHARKFRVKITEDDYTDNAGQSGDSGDIDKLVIVEDGKWGVYLGYKEVNALTYAFKKRFETKKKQDIEKRWQEYYTRWHPEYNMLSIAGMRAEVKKELYRQRRYGGSMTFAVISVRHNEAKSAGQEELLRSAAKTICGVLRTTDVPAYVGDSVFAMMFVELGRKNAERVIGRLAETIKKNAGSGLGAGADVEYKYESWSGNSFADMTTINNILKDFKKSLENE